MTYAEKFWGDCSKAAAYLLEFVSTSYGYDSDNWDDYYETCPHCDSVCRQFRDYEYPKSSIPKKDYFSLDTGDNAVSEKMKNDMVKFGISEDNFRPIYTRKHDTAIAYQIVPTHKLPLIYKTNGLRLRRPRCEKCGRISAVRAHSFMLETYSRNCCPIYISEEIFSMMKDINYVEGTAAMNEVIVSLDLYNYLIEKYPRMECRPVFIGNVINDPEYIAAKERRKNKFKKKLLLLK